MPNLKELAIALMWLALLGMVVLAGGNMIGKIQEATRKALP